MPRVSRWRLSPASRVAIGLVALMISLLLLTDLLVVDLVPDRTHESRPQRLRAIELTSSQVAQALRAGRPQDLQAVLSAALQREPGVRSAAVVDPDQALAMVGDHARHWRLAQAAPATADNLRAAIVVDGRAWGELQMAFTPLGPASVGQWLRDPRIAGMGLVTVLGFLAFQLYLRRAMRYLDPSAAVPERVRAALDTLVEAVLVLDTQGRIMLANRAFDRLVPESVVSWIGIAADELGWLTAALDAERPWHQVLRTGRALLGREIRVGAGCPGVRDLVMNCSPIDDGRGRTRGCLVTFSDVTELHERTEGLRVALAELHASREEIRQKNAELTLLATRDPLTGCLNRRAFLAESERCIATAEQEQTPLCVIMCDVDHFKSINDRFGHGGGDEVLKAVAKALARGMRTGDVLGRYGGEEFCVLLPDASLGEALAIAERLRADVQAHAGSAVRHIAGVQVTMSFGVEAMNGLGERLDALVERADQALYEAKAQGRNRVVAFEAMDSVGVDGPL